MHGLVLVQDIVIPCQCESFVRYFDSMGCAAAAPEDLLYLMVSAMLACDPTLDREDVQEISLNVTRTGEGYRTGRKSHCP